MYTHIKSVQILISLLKQFDIHHIVISPGTRNTALAGSIENDDFFTCYSIVDERSAGYFALGIAEALDVPVCVSCTAATATCNYLPAIKEAYERNIQLVALTADQNPYEMFHMEDQCIDQVDMFHGYVKCAIDIPKVLNAEDYWYCNRRINEALLELRHHEKGPVQINYHMHYRLDEICTYDVKELPTTRKIERIDIESCDFTSIISTLKNKRRILVVGGSNYDQTGNLRTQISLFMEKYNCVVVSDTYANVYIDNKKILNPGPLGDVITEDQISYLSPDLIISFGAVYYSTIKYFMSSYSQTAEHWQIAVDGMINDGYHCLTKVFEGKAEKFFERVNCVNLHNDERYYNVWKQRLELMHFPELDFTNLSVIQEFCRWLPDKALLHTTVLDSIRMSNYVELKPGVRCFANIGADGIDGPVSTYLGQAYNEEALTYLLIGDLSLMYDMNALLQKVPHNVRILVINNYAGAEFHKNFGQDRIPTLNNYIAAGHNVQIADCCDNSRFDYLSAKNMEELKKQLNQFMVPGEKPKVLEVFTDADRDAKILKDYWSINRQEIPGVKISFKSKLKRVGRSVLGKNTDKIKRIIKG